MKASGTPFKNKIKLLHKLCELIEEDSRPKGHISAMSQSRAILTVSSAWIHDCHRETERAVDRNILKSKGQVTFGN